MRKTLVLAAALTSLAGVGAVQAHDMGGHSAPMGGAMQQHSKREIAAGQPVPTVALDVQPDSMRGWNVHVKTTNFEFAPDRLNQKSAANEGHAHLYLNGKKLTRLYGSWYYLESLPTGTNTLTVTLNTNTHEELFYQGKRIEATQTITVPPAMPKTR